MAFPAAAAADAPNPRAIEPFERSGVTTDAYTPEQLRAGLERFRVSQSYYLTAWRRPQIMPARRRSRVFFRVPL